MAVTLKGYTANYLGLSTDAKPTEADDNAIFRELDTGKRYYFTGAAWAEIPSSGGGGGGDVTSVNGKTGAVTLTASDVGAYTTTETDALLGNKQNKTLSASVKIGAETETTVEGAIGEVAAIIPATAAVLNKLSTAADTAGEDITATANSEDIALTDAADARVHELKIYGKTENGHSVGENGLTVTVAGGKNMYNINGDVNSKWNGSEWVEDTSSSKNTVEDGVLTSHKNESNTTIPGQIINVQPNTFYTISFKCLSTGTSTSNTAVVRVRGMRDTSLLWQEVEQSSQTQSFSFNTGNNTFVVYELSSKRGYDAQFSEIQMEKGSTATAWEPYKSHTENITTALPLRRKMLTVDLGNFDWTYDEEPTYESGTVFHRFVSSTKAPGMFDPTRWTKKGISAEDAYLLATESCSSRYTVSNSAGAHDPVTDKTIIMGRDGTIYIIDNAYTYPAEFKAAVTGITLTYPSYCDEIDLADGVVITRIDSNGDALATPVTTPLTTEEKAAFAEFRTFDGNTNVTATDNPFMSMVYVKNTDNGKALADVDNRIEETFTATEKAKLAGIATGATANTVIDTTCTLTVAGWTGAAAPYTQTVNVTGILATDRPILDLSVSSTVSTGIDEIDDWALISKAETGAGTITFSCYEDIPATELTVNVKVVR